MFGAVRPEDYQPPKPQPTFGTAARDAGDDPDVQQPMSELDKRDGKEGKS